jgi:hypothetical protein
MRPDMAKVVTESPRRGHANKSEKHGGRLSKDDVAREREDDAERGGLIPWSRHRNHDYKEFSDKLGPLRAYLKAQVGRPWDKIYSELSQNLDKRSLAGIHIWDHVKQEVKINCVERDKKIYPRKVRFRSSEVPVEGLFVHPRTGLLCYLPEKRFRYRPKVDPDVIQLDDVTNLERREGIWYRCHYGFVDRYVPEVRNIYRGQTNVIRPAVWKTEKIFQRKKQLSRSELKVYKLTNTVK